MEEYVLGIDIGGSNIRMGAVGRTGAVGHHSFGSSRVFHTHTQPALLLQDMITAFVQTAQGTLRGICIGVPGSVSRDKQRVIACPLLPAFDGACVATDLGAAFGVPAIVDHDTLLLLYADLHTCRLRNKDCVAAFYLGTGFGNAIYVHGRLLQGRNGNAGEIAHSPVPGSTRICPCGNTGCVELYASGLRLEEIFETHFPTATSFDEMLRLHTDTPVIREFIENIAMAIVSEINILDPDVILLGGGVFNIPHFPHTQMQALIEDRVIQPHTADYIRLPQNPRQGILGAGLYGWDFLPGLQG